MRTANKYADQFMELLSTLGYTHCFFVPGGNIMHLLDSARSRMTCIPFVHEVSATVAVEYFNEISVPEGKGRAFALVTAGPGLTNAITGMAGAYLESRECLVIGGQVKSGDLAQGKLRQRGIQEIDGISIAQPVCKGVMRIEHPIPEGRIKSLILDGSSDRKGPIFIEFCLDAQGAPPLDTFSLESPENPRTAELSIPSVEAVDLILGEINAAQRPILLIGGGVRYEVARSIRSELARFGVPLMTTWNGADRVDEDHPAFIGRPNNWGQRSANILLHQADLVVALGTRLGLQQTGFNWEQWTQGRVVQVDVDRAELEKGHPRVDVPLQADANEVLVNLVQSEPYSRGEWIDFCRMVRERVPIQDPENSDSPGYLSPFALIKELSETLESDDIVIPASSGSGQFVPMEVHTIKAGQRMITNKGLASMGYGLAAACGAGIAGGGKRSILIEGDGSFSQGIQELGTAAIQNLNLKIFILDNDGYASIRTTQKNYFGGEYLGCDSSTGLGFPNWLRLAEAFGIPAMELTSSLLTSRGALELMESQGPSIFVVKVDPEQTYYPKVTSAISPSGSMVSNPTYLMTPELHTDLSRDVLKYRVTNDE